MHRGTNRCCSFLGFQFVSRISGKSPLCVTYELLPLSTWGRQTHKFGKMGGCDVKDGRTDAERERQFQDREKTFELWHRFPRNATERRNVDCWGRVMVRVPVMSLNHSVMSPGFSKQLWSQKSSQGYCFLGNHALHSLQSVSPPPQDSLSALECSVTFWYSPPKLDYSQ